MNLSAAPVCLSLKGVSKDYSVRVLNEIDFELRAGEIHALIGANGAGKSTLCKIISGLTNPTAGDMFLDHSPYSPVNKQQAEIRGVQIVQQELNLIPTLSIAENLFLTELPGKWGIINRRKLRQLARDLLDRFEMSELDVDREAGSLGIGQQQMIEIATSLNRPCRVLILDEPTAALSAKETEQLFLWLEELRRRSVGIIYVSHRLDEIKRLADRATVLRDGCRIGTYDLNELSTEKMVSLMTGEEHEKEAGQAAQISVLSEKKTLGQEVLRVESLCSGSLVKQVSFSVQAGECFGIAGLIGSGRTELLRAVFGADYARSGSVSLKGNSYRFKSPAEAVRHGLAMVTEDRKESGLLLSQSIRINSTLCHLREFTSSLGVIDQKAEKVETERLRKQMDIRFHDMEQAVETLSGGNQQKVVIAKWLLHGADVFLFDEPTRGIDVAARAKIHHLFAALREQGKGIVIVSSDLDELFETCDRIGVISAGKLVATFTKQEWSPEQIMQAAFSEYMKPSEE